MSPRRSRPAPPARRSPGSAGAGVQGWTDAPNRPRPPLDEPVRDDSSRPGARRATWTEGDSSVAGWGFGLAGWALVLLAGGIMASAVLSATVPGVVGTVLAALVLWAALLVPVVWGLRRSVPRTLLRFRGVDLLYGVVLGCALRLVQGGAELWLGGSGDLPSYPLIDGRLSAEWWFTGLVGVVLVAPVVEELFFRGVVLVALLTACRRLWGAWTGGFIAVVGSAGLFVVAHLLTTTSTWDGLLSVALLGLVCALLVLFTGRIWGAVLVHAMFNGTYVVLALAGTFLT